MNTDLIKRTIDRLRANSKTLQWFAIIISWVFFFEKFVHFPSQKWLSFTVPEIIGWLAFDIFLAGLCAVALVFWCKWLLLPFSARHRKRALRFLLASFSICLVVSFVTARRTVTDVVGIACALTLFSWVFYTGAVVTTRDDNEKRIRAAKAGKLLAGTQSVGSSGCLGIIIGLVIGAVTLFFIVLLIRWMWEKAGSVLH